MKKTLFLLIITLCILAISCLRRPDAPVGDPSIFKTPNTLENLIFNLEQAIIKNDKFKYLESFHDSFVFVPDPLDSSDFQYSGGFNKISEEAFIDELFIQYKPALGLDVSFDHTIQNVNPLDTVFRFVYEFATILDSNGAAFFDSLNLPVILNGSADIQVKEEENIFSIYKWEDLRRINVEGSTWGALKLKLILKN